MAPKHRIIIDTDPGVDDVLAILLALSASPEDLEVVMLSVTYGNVPLQGCLRNVVALFHVLEKELAWRRSAGKAEGFGALKTFKPIVAVGAEHPLEEKRLAEDAFHGSDGLHGVHEAHPDLTPAESWRALFQAGEVAVPASPSEPPTFSSFFTPSTQPAHLEMLRILREEPADTVTVIAIGPLTNVALAAAADPEALLRAREVVVMGGAVTVEGNITPVAEFNCYADPVAAARVFALTSPDPASTMPPDTKSALPTASKTLGPYPRRLSRRLKLSLFPLDITTPHLLNKGFFTARIAPLVASGSPLARWVETVLGRTFDKIEGILGDGSEPGLSLHDPCCVWYMMTRDDPAWRSAPSPTPGGKGEDIRVETSGQWTRGMHVVDNRVRNRTGGDEVEVPGEVVRDDPQDPLDAVQLDTVHADPESWLTLRKGNRINRLVSSPGEDVFAEFLMKQLFW